MLKLINLVLKFISQRRLRSLLTLVGIAIGVALVVSLVSINQGMLAYVEDSFGSLGGDVVIVSPDFGPGGLGGNSFSEEEHKALERLYFVKQVKGMDMTNLNYEVGGEDYTTRALGLEEGFLNFFGNMDTFEIERGRQLFDDESNKIMIGHALAEDHNLGPGSQIVVEGEKFRVVGVISQVGNREVDTRIYFTMQDFWDLTGREGRYMVLQTRVVEPKTELIEDELEDLRGRKDFNISTSENLLETINQVLTVLTAVFLAVASISIVVGVVGVANTMYMAVLERTRQIGVMKAVGATERQILLIFILESGFLSLIGGAVGMVLGYMLSYGLSIAASRAGISGLRPIVTSALILSTASASFILGVLSGVFPARQAARLQPVEALRQE